MATSKLFNPVVSEAKSDSSYAAEPADMFVNVPIHPEVRIFDGPTSGGEACYPLSLRPVRQDSETKWQKRQVVTKARDAFDY